MINDGHVHLHYEGQYARKIPAEIMLADMKKVDELKAKYKVDKIAAILLPPHIGLIPEIIKNRQTLKLGLYFNNFRELQEYQGTIEPFHFVKLHDDGLHYRTDALQEALNAGMKKGFKRFQFHSQCIGKDQLEVFAKFIKENDIKIYLAHGVFSLYPGFEEKYYRQASAEDVRRLAGNLFLGTTSTDSNDLDLYERLEKRSERWLNEPNVL